MWEQTGAHGIIDSYNMTSVTDGGAAGNTDHLFNVDFSTANYVGAGGPGTSGLAAGSITMGADGTAQAAGGCTTVTFNSGHSGTDSTENFFTWWGDQ